MDHLSCADGGENQILSVIYSWSLYYNDKQKGKERKETKCDGKKTAEKSYIFD